MHGFLWTRSSVSSGYQFHVGPQDDGHLINSVNRLVFFMKC